jgi:hypothetical protein
MIAAICAEEQHQESVAAEQDRSGVSSVHSQEVMNPEELRGTSVCPDQPVLMSIAGMIEYISTYRQFL